MNPSFDAGTDDRFREAVRRFDEENSRDPKRERFEGLDYPGEVLYARWLSDWVMKLQPTASESLRLAARSQHLCRWMIPRANYPMTRAGYLRWREDLKRFHAERSGEILRAVGYPEPMVARVQALNVKKDFPTDPETRVLEDALCLVFLQHQLAALAAKTSEEKVITAIRKSWEKMTPTARNEALKLSYGPKEQGLLNKALQGKPER